MSIVMGIFALIIILACLIVGFIAGVWYLVNFICKLCKPY